MRRLVALLICLTLATPLSADPIRIASFNTELSRQGPGLLLRDLTREGDARIDAVIGVILRAHPDILALQGIDWDLEGRTLDALATRLEKAGIAFPHRLTRRPNSGWESGQDLDGDGRIGGPGDSQGWGRFSGQGGIAVLSRFPILTAETQDFSALLWHDLPGAELPTHPDGTPFPSEAAQAAQRLSSTAHWAVPIALPDGTRLRLLTFQAGPPVFDGPEDRNGRRNADEIRFWRLYLDGAFGPAPTDPVVLAGGANLDPERGAGRHQAIRDLLADPRLQDPLPPEPTAQFAGPGPLRVDYLLPAAGWQVLDSGLAPADPAASRHRLIWVDLALPDQG
ncbi:endonuclease/exonuclease/phosphatase family protein [Pseudodonghicola flavimaris]|uniref:Endonuclease/exonuclease/phosphatase family protein n=1 Tax=Pseudodonghicola flavimaris TaxID=3050036 RepID=A0ABT7EWG1_9RHOB|nr:endonuclease/exonuclease/phosphatase family protein [Pseudodonghicola flavimaris]MDK3016682.1 endonuclease/exonuclease/phosphatase family protein [Pseudodonghicola flavimaris]